MLRNKLARGFIIAGSVLLSITAFLHLYLGLPPITAAIENGQIVKAPLLTPDELFGIWFAFSIIIFFMVAGILLHIRKPQIDRTVVVFYGLAPAAAAVTMLACIPGVHLSVPLLSVPGILIITGACIFVPDKTDSGELKNCEVD